MTTIESSLKQIIHVAPKTPIRSLKKDNILSNATTIVTVEQQKVETLYVYVA